MQSNIEIEVVAENRVDAFRVFSPGALIFEIKYIVLECGIDGRPTLRKNTDLESFRNIVRIVIDMDLFGRGLFFKPVEIDTFAIVPPPLSMVYQSMENWAIAGMIIAKSSVAGHMVLFAIHLLVLIFSPPTSNYWLERS